MAGIDYGMGLTNIDRETGIRYGVIPSGDLGEFWHEDGEQPIGYTMEGEYTATQSGGDSDVFVLKSPYYTRAEFCSPCAPGAAYLRSPTTNGDGPRAYCLHADCFDRHGEGCPYPIWEVATNRCVYVPPVGCIRPSKASLTRREQRAS